MHNHHNFAWREEHFGRDYWVIRKGCTPAFPGQEGFVGGSMGDESVILEGVERAENEAGALLDRARRRPRDVAHAGRGPRSPAQALRRAATATATARARRRAEQRAARTTRTQAEEVGSQEQVKPGVVDWPAVQARLREQGIVLIGGGADEAPEVYKRLPRCSPRTATRSA